MQVCPSVGHLLTLRDLLPEAEFLGPDDTAISGCTCDSRQCAAASCLRAAGNRPDGHEFVAEAVAGCAAVLSERPVSEASVPCCVVPDARQAYARICQTLAGHPSRQLKLIGVTGTNGKTTTSCLIAGVLTAADYRVGVLGTLGYLDGRRCRRGYPHHAARGTAGGPPGVAIIGFSESRRIRVRQGLCRPAPADPRSSHALRRQTVRAPPRP